MPKDVIIALDYPDREAALAFLDQFGEEKPFVKIGMELFYAAGRTWCARSRTAATRSSWI